MKLVAALALLAAAPAFATPVTLDFEHVTSFASVAQYYNGGTDSAGVAGTNDGVSFGGDMLALSNDELGPYFSNAPSALGVITAVGTDATLNVAAGFTGAFSFSYASTSFVASAVNIYSGLNGTGSLLASFNLVGNAAADGCTSSAYCHFDLLSTTFAGTAHSVTFGNAANAAVFGNNGFNVESLRDFNNAGPAISFGFESQPGHGASSNRGEYQVARNNIGGTLVDSVGGTTWGGTGVYASKVGGVWDALLGEGRNWWFFASSDWHNRGSFGPDDRRSTQDFYPGEYQRTYVMVRNNTDKLRPQTIVNGLRSGNAFSASGQLIDRLAFVACASYPGPTARTNAAVEAIAVTAATKNTDIDVAGCATMGEKLVVRPGAEIVVAIVARDPAGSNYSPYTFPNPSLQQVGITQPINMPVLDHIDIVRGMVTGYKQPGSADYAGQWPNTWLVNPDLATVPAAAKNTSAAVIKTFSGSATTPWTTVQSGIDNTAFVKMSYRIPAVAASQYVRLRGTNIPPAVPYETDADGNPLADVYTNANDTTRLTIPCTTVGTTEFNGCPSHLSVVGGRKMVTYDIAAWSDLWFYSNPIYVEVSGSTMVAGVK